VADFILRNVDPELWRRFKAAAALDGRTMREILIDFVERFVAEKLGRTK
jgi:hypothetical protein